MEGPRISHNTMWVCAACVRTRLRACMMVWVQCLPDTQTSALDQGLQRLGIIGSSLQLLALALALALALRVRSLTKCEFLVVGSSRQFSSPRAPPYHGRVVNTLGSKCAPPSQVSLQVSSSKLRSAQNRPFPTYSLTNR